MFPQFLIFSCRVDMANIHRVKNRVDLLNMQEIERSNINISQHENEDSNGPDLSVAPTARAGRVKYSVRRL